MIFVGVPIPVYLPMKPTPKAKVGAGPVNDAKPILTYPPGTSALEKTNSGINEASPGIV